MYNKIFINYILSYKLKIEYKLRELVNRLKYLFVHKVEVWNVQLD